MKREDAIKTLKELWRETNDPWYEEVYNMAINALEADRKTEPTISKMEQVDKDINVHSKDEPQNLRKITQDSRKDEPQTEYERASEQREYDILYEPIYNKDDGSM